MSSKKTITRGVEIYSLEMVSTKPNRSCKIEILNILNFLIKLDDIKRKKEFKEDEKIVYIDSFIYNKESEILNMKFISAKYNENKDVIDTITLADKGQVKNKDDGDKEYTHFSISFEENGRGIVACEKNFYGITFSKVIKYLNDLKTLYEEEGNFYNGDIFQKNIILNKDFVEALKKTGRIIELELYIDKKELDKDEFKEISQKDDIRKTVIIGLKAEKRMSIKPETVLEYYDKGNDNNKITRIKVNAETMNGPIIIDTECMKIKDFIVVLKDEFKNQAKTTSVYEELEKLSIKIRE